MEKLGIMTWNVQKWIAVPVSCGWVESSRLELGYDFKLKFIEALTCYYPLGQLPGTECKFVQWWPYMIVQWLPVYIDSDNRNFYGLWICPYYPAVIWTSNMVFTFLNHPEIPNSQLTASMKEEKVNNQNLAPHEDDWKSLFENKILGTTLKRYSKDFKFIKKFNEHGFKLKYCKNKSPKSGHFLWPDFKHSFL